MAFLPHVHRSLPLVPGRCRFRFGDDLLYPRSRMPETTAPRDHLVRARRDELDCVVLAAHGWSTVPVPPPGIAPEDDA